jgi:hypothetical protein
MNTKLRGAMLLALHIDFALRVHFAKRYKICDGRKSYIGPTAPSCGVPPVLGEASGSLCSGITVSAGLGELDIL